MRMKTAKEILSATLTYNMEAKAKGMPVDQLINPQLIGDPGIGKTTVVGDVAKELEWNYVSIIVAQYDSAELSGFPFLSEADDGTPLYKRARPDWMPAADGSAGPTVLLFDELSQAPLSNLNLIAQLANEHRLGEHYLPTNCVLVFANNKLSNKAGTVTLPTHLRDRLMPIDIEAHLDDVIQNFNERGASPELVSFLRVFPQRMAQFDARLDACPSPRSWMRVNTLIKMGMPNEALNHCIAGTVGAAAANDFRTHLDLHEKMIDPQTCINDPASAELPEDVSVSYILCAALAAKAEDGNIRNILDYATRLRHQDQVAFLVKDALMRTGGKASALLKNADMKKYLQTHGKELVL